MSYTPTQLVLSKIMFVHDQTVDGESSVRFPYSYESELQRRNTFDHHATMFVVFFF